jgi:hypothetical protein
MRVFVAGATGAVGKQLGLADGRRDDHHRHGGLNKFVMLNLIYPVPAAFMARSRFGPESFTA